MRSLMRAIAAVMRAMRSMVKTTVKIGDRLISMMAPAPMPFVDELEPATPTEVDQAMAYGEEAAIRNLAASMQGGRVPAPELFAAAGERASEWLMVMDERMLNQVVMSTNQDLHAHLRGRRTIRGLLRFEEEVVDDFRIAGLREQARQETVRRNLTPMRYA